MLVTSPSEMQTKPITPQILHYLYTSQALLVMKSTLPCNCSNQALRRKCPVSTKLPVFDLIFL